MTLASPGLALSIALLFASPTAAQSPADAAGMFDLSIEELLELTC